MRLSHTTALLTATCSTLALAAPPIDTEAQSPPSEAIAASSDGGDLDTTQLFPRANNCGCTSTRTCGCNEGMWCHCLTPDEGMGKWRATCAIVAACGCKAGKFGYCVR